MDILNTKIKSILTEKTTKIRPENIKSGVNILGINGNVTELNGETKTVTPTTSSQTITPTGTGKNALTQVTVNAVTSAIDNNIQAGNIKKDVTILGVTGTYEGGASEYNAKVVTTAISTSYSNFPTAIRFIKEFPAINLTGFTTCQSIFSNCSYLEKVELFDTSNITSMKQMFQNCVRLVSIPQFNTSKVTDMSSMFSGDEKLETIPILDTHLVAPYYMLNMFQGCPLLTNESLNNVLYMIAHCGSGSAYRTLQNIGLSSTQASTCTGLSNWASAQSAGWSTGY